MMKHLQLYPKKRLDLEQLEYFPKGMLSFPNDVNIPIYVYVYIYIYVSMISNDHPIIWIDYKDLTVLPHYNHG